MSAPRRITRLVPPAMTLSRLTPCGGSLERVREHPRRGLGDEAADLGATHEGGDVDALDQLLDVDPADDLVDVDALDDAFDVDPFDDPAHVDALDDAVDVDPLDDLLHVDAVDSTSTSMRASDRVHVDAGEQMLRSKVSSSASRSILAGTASRSMASMRLLGRWSR